MARTYSEYSSYVTAEGIVFTIFFSWAMYQVLARRFLERKIDERPYLERLPLWARHPSGRGLVIAWVAAIPTGIGYLLAIYMSWRYYLERREADSKVCPRCAERVKAAATLCRHCAYEFGPATSQPTRSTPAWPVEVAMTDSRPEVTAMDEDSTRSASEAIIAEKSHNPRLRSGKYLIGGGAIVVVLGLGVASGLHGTAGPTTYTDFRAHYSAASTGNAYMSEEQAHQFTSGWVTWLDTHPPEPCYSALHADLRAFYSALQLQPLAVIADDTVAAAYLPASTREDLLSAAATCKS